MEPTPQQGAKWDQFSAHWLTVRQSVRRALLISEINSKLQALINSLGLPYVVYTQERADKLQELLTNYNRMDQAIARVDEGVFALRFNDDGTIDICAPPHMSDEEIQGHLNGLGFGPLVWVIVIGAVVVGGLFGTSAVIDSASKQTEAEEKEELMGIATVVSKLPKPAQEWFWKFVEKSKDELQELGFFEKLFGKGNTMMIVGLAGAAILLFAVMGRRK